MDSLLGTKSLPPGFRFHPTDEELFMFYLKRKILGKSLGHQMMSEVDAYRFAPWDLPAKACLQTRDLNWYFLCPRAKKYPNGGRANRATECGYWKSTGTDRTVQYNNRPVGKIKTLIFHRGKPPKGERTDWVMHEYRLEDKLLSDQGVAQDSYVICKIYKKSGLGPKNGEHYGAPFVEEEWDSDNDDNTELVLHPDKWGIDGSPVSNPVDTAAVIPNGTEQPASGTVEQSAPAETVLPPIELEEDELDRLLAAFKEDDYQMFNSDIYDGLGDLAGGTSSSGVDFDLSDFLLDDGFLELKDLQD